MHKYGYYDILFDKKKNMCSDQGMVRSRSHNKQKKINT